MLQCNVFDDFERQLWVGEPTIEMNCPSAALSRLGDLGLHRSECLLSALIATFENTLP